MKKVIKNLIFGFGGQMLTLAMSIILPRFILVSFGSEANGVTSTVTQIFTYITLLEAGIGNASKNCLYKNLAEKDRTGICTTVSATQKFFNRVTPIYIVCIVAFMLIFPLMLRSELPTKTIRLIILLQGISGVINFCCTNAYVQLLSADGRNYVSSNLNLLSKFVSTVGQIVLIIAGFDIISVQLSLLVANIVKAIAINVYIRRKYPWLFFDPAADVLILEQRKAFVVHEVSSVIFNGTDVLLISVFCSLKEASVYAIYNLVYAAVSMLTGIVFKSMEFNLGTEFHRDRQKYIRLHDTYAQVVSCIMFATISAVYMVVCPFVQLYTAGVTDVQYIRPELPLLFSAIQLLSMSRCVCSNLITISGEVKNTIPNSIIESAINLVASILLVNVLGVAGVLAGTVIALLYRTNDIIIYANLKILRRKPWRAYKTLLLNSILFAIMVVAIFVFPLPIENYVQFVFWGVLALAAMIAYYFGANCVFDRNMRESILSMGKIVLKVFKSS